MGKRADTEKAKQLLSWKASHRGAPQTAKEAKELQISETVAVNFKEDVFVELFAALLYAVWDGLQAPIYENGTSTCVIQGGLLQDLWLLLV